MLGEGGREEKPACGQFGCVPRKALQVTPNLGDAGRHLGWQLSNNRRMSVIVRNWGGFATVRFQYFVQPKQT